MEMKKIINGKIYDEDKSELIYADNENKRLYYVTKNGAYFVVYKRVNKLELCSVEEIMELLAEKDPDKYIELFGEVEEG